MSDYLKSTNFATKDSLPSGNAGKIVKGTEIDNEFNAIADAIESKADLLNPTFSGLLTTDTLTTGGATNIGGTLAVAGALTAADDVQFTGTGRLLFPKGTTAQRPVSPVSGSVRYNTTLGYLENYNGTEWLAVGYVTPADVSDKVNTSTGYFQVPVGNIAQRPVSPAEGLLRYNSESDIYEGYINGAWHRFLTANQGSYNINYVAVGGGGGTKEVGSSGIWNSGGAGGGKVTSSTTSVTPGTTILTITVGGGGALGVNGSSSSITGVVDSIGGYTNPQAGGNDPTGGASGNGYAGGAGIGTGAAGGGGGGAGGVGQAGHGSGGEAGDWLGGNGGVGLEILITGTSQTLAGGGGGGAYAQGGTGLNGGGNGNGGTYGGGSAGTVNTGGGGGGNYGTYGGQGMAGGSGVVFLSMPTVNYTGTHTGSPTIITTGSNTVLKFTGSGTYTC